MLIVVCKCSGDAKKPRSCPLDAVCLLFPDAIHDEPPEIGFMVHQPVEIEQPLVNDVFIECALVLDDNRAAVLVNTERINAATVGLAGGILGGEEADTEERIKVLLDQRLERL